MNFHHRRDSAHTQKMAKTRNQKLNNTLLHFLQKPVSELVNSRTRVVFRGVDEYGRYKEESVRV